MATAAPARDWKMTVAGFIAFLVMLGGALGLSGKVEAGRAATQELQYQVMTVREEINKLQVDIRELSQVRKEIRDLSRARNEILDAIRRQQRPR